MIWIETDPDRFNFLHNKSPYKVADPGFFQGGIKHETIFFCVLIKHLTFDLTQTFIRFGFGISTGKFYITSINWILNWTPGSGF